MTNNTLALYVDKSYTRRVIIETDGDVNTRGWSNLGTLLLGENRTIDESEIGNEIVDILRNAKSFADGISSVKKECIDEESLILPISKYEHGGTMLTVWAEGEGQSGFGMTAFDYGWYGLIFATETAILDWFSTKNRKLHKLTTSLRKRAIEVLNDEIDVFNQSNNDGFVSWKEYRREPNQIEWELHDSCCGYCIEGCNDEDYLKFIDSIDKPEELLKQTSE